MMMMMMMMPAAVTTNNTAIAGLSQHCSRDMIWTKLPGTTHDDRTIKAGRRGSWDNLSSVAGKDFGVYRGHVFSPLQHIDSSGNGIDKMFASRGKRGGFSCWSSQECYENDQENISFSVTSHFRWLVISIWGKPTGTTRNQPIQGLGQTMDQGSLSSPLWREHFSDISAQQQLDFLCRIPEILDVTKFW